MSEKRRLLHAAGLIGAFTLFSRFTGLLRDMVLAALFGATRLADTFNTSFELVNQIRRVLGEGALSSFIVPIFTEHRHADPKEAWRFFNRTVNFMVIACIGISIAGMIYAREVFMAFGGIALVQLQKQGKLAGSEVEHYLALGAEMTAIMFPYVIGIALVALFMGACHALRSFTAPSIGSVMLNLAMIIAGGGALAAGAEMEAAAYWLCWSVLAGALLRLAIMVPPLHQNGWRWQPVLSLRDPQLRKLLGMIGLGMIGMTLSQLNVAISGFFAWYLGEGIKTNITYANRLIQLPMALTATAVATALLPQLTQFLIEGRRRELRDMMSFIKRLEIVFMVPAVVALILLGYPITALVFERRAFTADDTWGTYLALMAYAPGLLPLGWVRLLQPLYYARKDLWTPLYSGAVSVVVNVALNWFFAFHTGLAQIGLGFSNTLASFAGYLVLSYFLKGDLRPQDGETTRIGETFGKSLIAALVACGAGLGGYVGWIYRFGEPAGSLRLALVLLPILVIVSILYFAMIRFLDVPDSARAAEILRRKFRV